MRLKLLSCEIFHREMCAVVARSPNQVDMEFMPKGLHDIPASDMCGKLQAAVDRTPPGQYEAVILGYALCNNGLHGLTARDTPLVLPRAHDCISMFLGSKERYREYFFANPGVYFKTTGWIERDKADGELRQLTIQHQSGMDRTYQDLVDQYGEDNARYLHEQLYDTTRHYKQITFIEMGIEPDDRFERQSRAIATERGWTFDKVAGDMGLIQRLVDGAWDDREFLVLAPGQRVAASQDDRIVCAETADGTPG